MHFRRNTTRRFIAREVNAILEQVKFDVTEPVKRVTLGEKVGGLFSLQ
jgi:hypothetical protein